jgi:hypothetical protein
MWRPVVVEEDRRDFAASEAERTVLVIVACPRGLRDSPLMSPLPETPHGVPRGASLPWGGVGSGFGERVRDPSFQLL